VNILTTYRVEFDSLEGIHTPPGNEDLGDSSIPTSASPSSASQQSPPSAVETDDSPTEGDRSSQSQHSSAISDSRRSDRDEDNDHCNRLEDLIKKDVLRTDPEVAELLFQALDGKIECASPNRSAQFEDSGEFSLLLLLGVQDSSIIHHSGTMTTHMVSSSSSSSSSSASASDQASVPTSSSNRQSRASKDSPADGGGLPPRKDGRQLIKQRNDNARSGSVEYNKPQLFRCFHNALAPDMFCVNHDTREKFRACAGPGWKTIHHLK
jgi:hypothetical protein